MRLAIALSLLVATAAAAGTITFPLVVDYPILEAALRRDLGLPKDESLELWGSPGDCRWAVVDDLSVGTAGEKLRLGFDGATVAGFRLLWFCISPFTWQGRLVLDTSPVVGRDWQLRFEGLDVEARDRDGAPSPLTNTALQLMKGRLEERLGAFRFDLAPPIDEAKALIRSAAASGRAKVALAALDTLRPLDTTVDADGVGVRIAFEVPDAAAAQPSPEPALTEDEVRAWEERLDRWEAFLVFTVKMLAQVTDDRRVRTELLDILLDARQDLVDVLRQGPIPGTDPVRNLFLSSWDRLRVQARRALREGEVADRASRFITFLAAGDALAALDQAGPALGLEISGDGLRRLARLIDPAGRDDPIPMTDALDPELRDLFGFEAYKGEDTPPRPPATSTTTGVPPTTAVPTPATPDTTVPTSTLPISWLWSPREAGAATLDLAAIGQHLDRWVPADEELHDYRAAVEQLLTAVTAHRVDRLEARLRPVYRPLVPAVAWQESCWRQFVERNGSVTVLLSRTGDVGLMQVNRRVWRGFFDIRKLEADVVYNAAAGAEILAQLLERVGVKEAGRVLDDAARASYSAYNAGPGAYRRYRTARPTSLGRAIDDDFYAKYRRMADGTAGNLVLCMG